MKSREETGVDDAVEQLGSVLWSVEISLESHWLPRIGIVVDHGEVSIGPRTQSGRVRRLFGDANGKVSRSAHHAARQAAKLHFVRHESLCTSILCLSLPRLFAACDVAVGRSLARSRT